MAEWADKFCGGSYTRVQNTTSDTAVKSAPGYLYRIVVTNANASVQSLTVRDGATVLGVYEIPADNTLSLAFGVKFGSSIKLQPGSTDIDALAVYD